MASLRHGFTLHRCTVLHPIGVHLPKPHPLQAGGSAVVREGVPTEVPDRCLFGGNSISASQHHPLPQNIYCVKNVHKIFKIHLIMGLC